MGRECNRAALVCSTGDGSCVDESSIIIESEPDEWKVNSTLNETVKFDTTSMPAYFPLRSSKLRS